MLLSGAFARRVAQLEGRERAHEVATSVAISTPVSAAPTPRTKSSDDATLGLLAIFQREGRLVDFLEQDIDTFPDVEIGAAARVVHGGCRRALRAHFDLARVRPEAEGTTVTVLGAEVREVKLTGNVQGSAPYTGVLRHAGWRALRTRMPELAAGHDASVVCQAEVEL